MIYVEKAYLGPGTSISSVTSTSSLVVVGCADKRVAALLELKSVVVIQ